MFINNIFIKDIIKDIFLSKRQTSSIMSFTTLKYTHIQNNVVNKSQIQKNRAY